MLKGIDVSFVQGRVDWDKLKGNIDFAIIRCGYGNNQANQDDVQWARNVAECNRLGIPWGTYLYSYATSAADAGSEAVKAGLPPTSTKLLQGRITHANLTKHSFYNIYHIW